MVLIGSLDTYVGNCGVLEKRKLLTASRCFCSRASPRKASRKYTNARKAASSFYHKIAANSWVIFVYIFEIVVCFHKENSVHRKVVKSIACITSNEL